MIHNICIGRFDAQSNTRTAQISAGAEPVVRVGVVTSSVSSFLAGGVAVSGPRLGGGAWLLPSTRPLLLRPRTWKFLLTKA